MVISMGLGDAMSVSWRQKFNTGISTEAEIVVIDDAIKSIMWGLYFVQEQGYEVNKNILMQDNKSNVLLAKNVRFYISKRNKPTKNRYFMIKDKIGSGAIFIQYCPAGDMCANINTKAIQEKMFYKIRGLLMGIGEDYADEIERRNTHPDLKSSQECAVNVSAKDASLLTKVGAIVKFIAVTKAALTNSTKDNQAAVSDLLLTRTMEHRT